MFLEKKSTLEIRDQQDQRGYNAVYEQGVSKFTHKILLLAQAKRWGQSPRFCAPKTLLSL